MRTTYRVEVEVTAEVQTEADYSNERLAEDLHDTVFAGIREETELDVVIMTVSPSRGEGPGITLTRGQLEAWAGRTLTDEEVEQLDEAIPNSSIPEAIATIMESVTAEEES